MGEDGGWEGDGQEVGDAVEGFGMGMLNVEAQGLWVGQQPDQARPMSL